MIESLTTAEKAERALNPHKPLFIQLLDWKLIVPLSILLTLIAALLVVRSYMLGSIPDIGDPFDVAAFGTVNLSDAENARVEYEQAVALIVPLPKGIGRTVSQEFDLALEEGWTYASPMIKTWLDDNRPAMEKWKLGTEKPSFLLHQPKDANIGTSFSIVHDMRHFARLARLETSRLLEVERPDDAWIWSRTTYRCSRHLAQHGGLMERLIGIAIHAMCMESLQDIVEHPDTNETLLREMLDELHEQFATTVSCSNVLKCEYLSFKNTIHDEKVLEELTSFELRATELKVLYVFYHAWGVEPQLSQLVWQQYVANLLDQVDLPLYQRQPRIGKMRVFKRDPSKSYSSDLLEPAELDRQYMESIVARTMAPAFSEVDLAYWREASKQHAIELIVALRIYQLQHGAYPPDLQLLVDAGIISEIPIDPYSPTGDKMNYRRAGDETFVWGVGENGIDDGGANIVTEGSNSLIDLGFVLGRKKVGSVEAQKPYPDNQ